MATTFISVGAGAAYAGDDAPSYAPAVSGHTISVSVAAPWHVNSSYPWKAVNGDSKLKTFTFSETTATLANVPSGTWTVSAGACKSDGSSCSTKSLTVTVP